LLEFFEPRKVPLNSGAADVSDTSYALDITRDDLGHVLSMVMPRPSNFHAHLRLGALMQAVARQIMRWIKYLLVMPNTGTTPDTRHILSVADGEHYFAKLMEIALEAGCNSLRLLMTVYHSALTTPRMIGEIAHSAVVYAVKHFPPEPGVTTGSGGSVPLEDCDEMLSAMEDHKVPLLGHFAITTDKYGKKLSPLQWEKEYVETRLWRLRDKHPRLRICCEHASTKDMVEFVRADTSGNTVMTVTSHHPQLPYTMMHERSWGTLLKSQPFPQTPENMHAVREFMVSGDERVIAGDDCAPHPASKKLLPLDQCNNGCYTPHSVPMYVKMFEEAGALDERFVRVLCLNGPKWWGLPPPRADEKIRIRAESEYDIPDPDPIAQTHRALRSLPQPSASLSRRGACGAR
jgi:dihydroorotase